VAEQEFHQGELERAYFLLVVVVVDDAEPETRASQFLLLPQHTPDTRFLNGTQ